MGGGGLQDERGSIGGDDGVGGGRRRGGGNPAFFILVSLYVLGQVVAPHEPLGALCAHKLLLSCGISETITSDSVKPSLVNTLHVRLIDFNSTVSVA